MSITVGYFGGRHPAGWHAAGLPDTPLVLIRSDDSADLNLKLVFVHFPLPHRKAGSAIERQ